MELTQQRLKEVLHYDPKTGDFIWKTQTNSRATVGRVAGTHVKGYVMIRLDKKLYSAHRLAFLYRDGGFPGVGLQVDHINHVRSDNSWKNLRIVTRQENQKNFSMGKNNTSGVVGVHWSKRDEKWISKICINGKLKHLGYFDDKNEAIKVRKAAERKYGFHENHGKAKVRMVKTTIIPV